MVMFSQRITAAMQAFQTNIASLQEERGKIKTSEGDLDELIQGFQSNIYPPELQAKMDAQVRSYILARRTRDRAKAIFDFLTATIARINRYPVSSSDNQTNAELGGATKWTKKGIQTVHEIIPQLQTLAKKVDIVRNNIAAAMDPVSEKLNLALSYSYPYLKIVGTKELWEIWGLNQLPRARAYRDHAIALMEPTMPPAPNNPFVIKEDAALVDPETDTSKTESEALDRLLTELKQITASIQLEAQPAESSAPSDSQPQTDPTISVSSQASAAPEDPASVASAEPANNPAASRAADISLAIPAPSIQVTVSSQASSSAAASEPSGPSSQTTRVYTPRSPSTMSISSEGDTELQPLALPVGSPAPAPAPVLATVLSTRQSGGKQTHSKKQESAAAAAGTASGSSENSSRKSSGNDGRPRRTNS